MTFLTVLLGAIFLILIVAGIVFVGFYVVLPIVLFCAICSAVGALIRMFMPQNKIQKRCARHPSQNQSDQIIDVEFEEIK